jgi:hypothetical protein
MDGDKWLMVVLAGLLFAALHYWLPHGRPVLGWD